MRAWWGGRMRRDFSEDTTLYIYGWISGISWHVRTTLGVVFRFDCFLVCKMIDWLIAGVFIRWVIHHGYCNVHMSVSLDEHPTWHMRCPRKHRRQPLGCSRFNPPVSCFTTVELRWAALVVLMLSLTRQATSYPPYVSTLWVSTLVWFWRCVVGHLRVDVYKSVYIWRVWDWQERK